MIDSIDSRHPLLPYAEALSSTRMQREIMRVNNLFNPVYINGCPVRHSGRSLSSGVSFLLEISQIK